MYYFTVIGGYYFCWKLVKCLHSNQRDEFHCTICEVLGQSCHDNIPGAKVKDGRDYNVPGVSEYLKDLHTMTL